MTLAASCNMGVSTNEGQTMWILISAKQSCNDSFHSLRYAVWDQIRPCIHFDTTKSVPLAAAHPTSPAPQTSMHSRLQSMRCLETQPLMHIKGLEMCLA